MDQLHAVSRRIDPDRSAMKQGQGQPGGKIENSEKVSQTQHSPADAVDNRAQRIEIITTVMPVKRIVIRPQLGPGRHGDDQPGDRGKGGLQPVQRNTGKRCELGLRRELREAAESARLHVPSPVPA